MAYKNREDQRAYAREHYKRHKALYKARARTHTDRVRKEIAKLLKSRADVPCVDCDVRYPHYVMDFDHVRGEKAGNIADYSTHGWSLKTAQAEVDKCDVVCANCHRERTWG